MDEPATISWRGVAASALVVFLIASVGCGAAFAIWLNDLYAPQIAILGSGNRLSMLVVDGPARLVLAIGDDPIGYENALTRVRPIFARRVDVLLVAGDGDSLLVPLAAHGDPHSRVTSAIAPLAASPASDSLEVLSAQPGHSRYRLGPSLTITIDTRYPFGADPAVDFPAWRAIVERGESRVVVLSDGESASLFPPVSPVSALVISGEDPVSGWSTSPAPALIANAGAIGGPDLRSAFVDVRQPPEWGFLVFSGEALRLRFVQDGIAIASESAHQLD